VIREELEKRFISVEKWDRVLKFIDDIKETFVQENKKLDLRFSAFKEEESKNVDKTVEGLLDGKFSKYEAVRQEFRKFFG